ncbi:hypothetical protein [Hyalangium versicolor]|uniref:hypothetical protein n=1 Tax=Hyalangium versicolor TaxID=2861190 RepID=UPI001CC90F4D|nr:hypothetical protein [Hyalangium versicolor]
MRHQLLKMFAFVMTLFVVSGAAVASEPSQAATCTDLGDQLAKAAESAGIPINREQTVTTTSNGVAFAGTSIAGFEQIPATQFPKGVDAGFIYLSSPESGIPAGYYRLRTTASDRDIRVGSYPGIVSLVNLEGKVVTVVPATIDTFSVSVPKPLPFERTLMDAQIASEGQTLLRPYLTITIKIRCPNGSTITITIRI